MNPASLQSTSFHLRVATEADKVLLAELGAETFFDTFAVDPQRDFIMARHEIAS